MEFINLTEPQEINDFKTYIKAYPHAVVKINTLSKSIQYVLTTKQSITIPKEDKYDKLIFGKNQEEEIVNISYKNQKCIFIIKMVVKYT